MSGWFWPPNLINDRIFFFNEMTVVFFYGQSASQVRKLHHAICLQYLVQSHNGVERGRYMSTILDLAKIGGVPNDSSNLHRQISSHSAIYVAGMVALEEIWCIFYLVFLWYWLIIINHCLTLNMIIYIMINQ